MLRIYFRHYDNFWEPGRVSVTRRDSRNRSPFWLELRPGLCGARDRGERPCLVRDRCGSVSGVVIFCPIIECVPYLKDLIGDTMPMRSPIVALVLFLITLPSLLVAEQYKVKSRLHLQGDSGWDYLTVDPESRELYVTHGTELQIVNLDSQEAIAKVAGMKRIHGVAIVKDLNRGFVSDGGDNAMVIFDLKSHSILNKVPTGKNPDAILYDPFTKRIFVFNGASNDATVIEAASASVVGTLPLNGRPEFAVTDGKGNVYVNIENRSELLQLDPQALKVKKTWALAPIEEPSGLAFDEQTRRRFSVCSNRQMAVVDADSGKIVAMVPIGTGPDAAVYDPDNKLIFSSNGADGTLTVVKQESADKYTVLDNIPTTKRARTLTLHPQTHKIYLSAAEF